VLAYDQVNVPASAFLKGKTPDRESLDDRGLTKTKKEVIEWP